jgi:hypothetical protein
VGFELRFDPEYGDAVAAVFAGCEREGGCARGDLVAAEFRAQVRRSFARATMSGTVCRIFLSSL